MARTAKRPTYRMTPRVEPVLGVWEDATSYSQRDPYPRVPRSWRIRLTRDVVLTVVSEHIYYPGKWVARCEPWFDMRDLNIPATIDNDDEAQRAALALVRQKIAELSAAIAKFN